MGFRICLLATRQPIGSLLSVTGLAVTREQLDLPTPETPLWACTLKSGGWTILWCEQEDWAEQNKAALAALSRHAPVYHHHVNETVMWLSTAMWADGACLWDITYDANADQTLTSRGDLPDHYRQMAQTARETISPHDDEADCTDEVPFEVLRDICGFNHDDSLSGADVVDGFHLLEPRPAARPGLLARLFGR